MTDVIRYDPMGYDKMSGYMDETPLGDYVRAEDYDRLRAALDEAREILTEINREDECRMSMILYGQINDWLAANPA